MRLGQQVRVTSKDRPSLKDKIGIIEHIVEHSDRQFYGVRLPPPYHEVLFYMKVWELGRTT